MEHYKLDQRHNKGQSGYQRTRGRICRPPWLVEFGALLKGGGKHVIFPKGLIFGPGRPSPLTPAVASSPLQGTMTVVVISF
jgi:hypothetical protein